MPLQTFSTLWKIAKIILIPKSSKVPYLASSYKPISLLSTLSKLFEKSLLKYIKISLNEKNVLPSVQFDFRDQHSTIQQIHFLIKKYYTAVFLDLTKAFDKAWHLVLLYKINKHLPDPLPNILKNYLQNRKFYINYYKTRSVIKDIKPGVP